MHPCTSLIHREDSLFGVERTLLTDWKREVIILALSFVEVGAISLLWCCWEMLEGSGRTGSLGNIIRGQKQGYIIIQTDPGLLQPDNTRRLVLCFTFHWRYDRAFFKTRNIIITNIHVNPLVHETSQRNQIAKTTSHRLSRESVAHTNVARPPNVKLRDLLSHTSKRRRGRVLAPDGATIRLDTGYNLCPNYHESPQCNGYGRRLPLY